MSYNPYQDPALYSVSMVPIYGCPIPQLPDFSNEPHECEPITVETIKDDYARIMAAGEPQFARNAIEMANAMRDTMNRSSLGTTHEKPLKSIKYCETCVHSEEPATSTVCSVCLTTDSGNVPAKYVRDTSCKSCKNNPGKNSGTECDECEFIGGKPTMYDPVAHDTEKPGPLEQPAECTDDHAEYDSRRFEEELDVQLGNIREMLIEKNRQYGDSALNPVRVFSKASPREQLLVRIDDKISRLSRGQNAGEDTVNDLLGYLVMLRILDARMTK